MTDLPEGWLGREQRARNFVQIIQADTRPRVISIEGGFGYGKTIFCRKLATLLRDKGETVIEFDAWASDHTDDPLIAFVGKLLEAMPPKVTSKSKKRRDAALSGVSKIVKTGFVVGAKAAAGSFGANAASEALGLADDSEIKALIEQVATAVGGEVSGQVVSLLAAQMAMEKARSGELPGQLAALRDELESAKRVKDRNGRVVVVIDELDRCRPDYAIALLEAIKHLFRQEGYVFVLMINPQQIERTSTRLFGEIGEGEEPYISKFIDLHLALGPPEYKELAQHLVSPLAGRYTSIKNSPELSFESCVARFAEYGQNNRALPRQMEAAVLHTDITLSLIGNEPIDLGHVLQLALHHVMLKVKRPNSYLRPVPSPPWYNDAKSAIQKFESLQRSFTNPSQQRTKFFKQLIREANEIDEIIKTKLAPIFVGQWENSTDYLGHDINRPNADDIRPAIDDNFQVIDNLRDTIERVYDKLMPEMISVAIKIQADAANE